MSPRPPPARTTSSRSSTSTTSRRMGLRRRASASAPLDDKWQAFGWQRQRVDGNDPAGPACGLRRGATATEARPPRSSSATRRSARRAVPRERARRRTSSASRARMGDWRASTRTRRPRDELDPTKLKTIGDDRLDRRRGAADHARAVRPCAGALADERPEIVGLSADLAKYTDLHVFADAPSRSLLPDGHGRAGACSVPRRAWREVASCRSPRPTRVFASRRAYDFIYMAIAEEPAERQDRLRAARAHHRLRAEPSGHRGHRDLPRHAQPRRSSTPATQLDIEQATERSPTTTGRSTCGCCAARSRCARRVRPTGSSSARPELARRSRRCPVHLPGLMTMRALEAARAA